MQIDNLSLCTMLYNQTLNDLKTGLSKNLRFSSKFKTGNELHAIEQLLPLITITTDFQSLFLSFRNLATILITFRYPNSNFSLQVFKKPLFKLMFKDDENR